MEFPGGSMDIRSSTVTAVSLVTTVVWVQSLAQKFPHATGMAKKNNFFKGIKGQYTDGDKIFQYTCDTELVSRIYKELSKQWFNQKDKLENRQKTE